MSEEVPEEYFADLISNVSHANGVFRLTFAQQEVENAVRPVVRILIPANQLQNAVRSITGAANEIREKVQAQMDGAEGDDGTTTEGATDATTGDDAMGEPAAEEKSGSKRGKK